MKKLLVCLFVSMTLVAPTGCAKKKVKPEAESNESRKSRDWNYEQIEKNQAAEQAAETEKASLGKVASRCLVILVLPAPDGAVMMKILLACVLIE